MNYTTKFFTKVEGKTDDELSAAIYEKCGNDLEPKNHTNTDGKPAACAYGCVCNYDGIEYDVTVIFSEDQVKDASNEDGIIEDAGRMEWDNPQEIIITEV